MGKERKEETTVEENAEEEVPTTVTNAISKLTLEEEINQEEAAEIVIPNLEETEPEQLALPSSSKDTVDVAEEKEGSQRYKKEEKQMLVLQEEAGFDWILLSLWRPILCYT